MNKIHVHNNSEMVFGIIIVLIISLLISIIIEDNAFVLMWCYSISVILIWFLLKNLKVIGKKNTVFFLLLIMLLILPFQAKYNFLPLSGNDRYGFEKHVIDLENQGSNLLLILFSSKTLYVKIIALFYHYFGHHVMIVYFLSFWSYCLSILLVQKSMILLNISKKFILFGVYYFVFSPIEVVFAMSYLREMPMQLFSILVLFNCLKYLKTHKIYYLISSVLLTVIASMFHSAMISLIAIIIGTIVSNTYKSKGKKFIDYMIVFALVSVLLSLNAIGLMTEKFGHVSTESLINGMSYASGNTTYVNTQVTSVSGFIKQIPYRLLMFSLAPFPWQIRNIGSLIAFVLTSLTQYFLILHILGLLFKRNGKINKMIIFSIVSLIVLYVICAIGTNNYGTAIRHRVKMYPVACLVLAYGLNVEKLNGEISS